MCQYCMPQGHHAASLRFLMNKDPGACIYNSSWHLDGFDLPGMHTMFPAYMQLKFLRTHF